MPYSGDFSEVQPAEGGGGGDARVPLLNLSAVRSRMDLVQRFLSESVNRNTLIGKSEMDMVSTEISAAIHQIIVNGAALLACTQQAEKAGPQRLVLEGDGGLDLKFGGKLGVFQLF